MSTEQTIARTAKIAKIAEIENQKSSVAKAASPYAITAGLKACSTLNLQTFLVLRPGLKGLLHPRAVQHS
jgi:hypothetical protein